METPANAEYLGDSVYGTAEFGAVTIWLDNGDGPKHVIVLDPEVINGINRLMHKALEAQRKGD